MRIFGYQSLQSYFGTNKYPAKFAGYSEKTAEVLPCGLTI